MKKQLEKEEIISLIKQGCAPITIRNIGQYAVNIVEILTENCEAGSLAERMYWIKMGIDSRPLCAHCESALTKKSFRNGGELGYRTFCSRRCSASAESRKNDVRETSLLRYGVEHPLQSEIVQSKRQATNLERYGDTNPMKWSGNIFKSIMIDKYGGINPMSSPILRESTAKSAIKKKKENFIDRCLMPLIDECKKNGLILVGSINDYEDQTSKMRWSCTKCGKETYRSFRNPKCDHCDPTSRPQMEICNYVREIIGNDNVISDDRTAIGPLELDVYVPSKNVAIELNGSFWHSTRFQDNKNYHLNKKQLCEKAGIKLLHVWDHQWYESKELIKSKIAVTLGKCSRKIYARKCLVGVIPVEMVDTFVKENHLQGTALSTYALALFYEGMIIGAMTFGHPRFSRQHQWELIRYVTLKDIQIIGGASRLLTEFKKRMMPMSIISYADRLMSDGNVYEKIGMTLIRTTSPGYFYTNNRGERVSRYRAMKGKLEKLLGIPIDKTKTEEEIMRDAGWFRVYDAGQLVYEWTMNKNT